jgi:hypothetical protein
MKRMSSGMLRRITSALTATVVLMNLANAAGDIVWFNGGFDNRNGLASERNTQVSDARTYEDFSLPSGYNQVTGLLGQFYLSAVLVNAPVYWEIRQGVAAGTGGTLIASGTQSGATYTAIGSGFGFTIYEIRMKLDTPVTLCTQHRLLDDDGASGQRQWSRLRMPRPAARAQSAPRLAATTPFSTRHSSTLIGCQWRATYLRCDSGQLLLWRSGDSGACEHARAGRGAGGLAGAASARLQVRFFKAVRCTYAPRVRGAFLYQSPRQAS